MTAYADRSLDRIATALERIARALDGDDPTVPDPLWRLASALELLASSHSLEVSR